MRSLTTLSIGIIAGAVTSVDARAFVNNEAVRIAQPISFGLYTNI